MFLSEDIKWPHKLVFLTVDSIFWYKQDWEVEDVIINRGDFPNMPLIGTQGFINYNPSLSMRKLRYPMEVPLEDRLFEAFILHDMGVENPIMMKRIRIAWGRVNRKGKELG